MFGVTSWAGREHLAKRGWLLPRRNLGFGWVIFPCFCMAGRFCRKMAHSGSAPTCPFPGFRLGRKRTHIRQRSPRLLQAVGGRTAPCGTGQIVMRIQHKLSTMRALAAKIVFEKLHRPATVAAGELKDVLGIPIAQILARALRLIHPTLHRRLAPAGCSKPPGGNVEALGSP